MEICSKSGLDFQLLCSISVLSVAVRPLQEDVTEYYSMDDLPEHFDERHFCISKTEPEQP